MNVKFITMTEQVIVFWNNKYVTSSQSDFHNHSTSGMLYEVVRVMEGIPLFLDDHIQRLRQSVDIAGHYGVFPEPAFFEEIIFGLIKKNKRDAGNIQINIVTENNEFNTYSSFIPHSYPSAEAYKKGVNTDFLFAERKTPEAKVIQKKLRQRANDMINQKSLFEVILVDKQQMVTEGSRSNIFIVHNDEIFTAPLNMVLGGITRKKTIAVLDDMNRNVIEEPWNYRRVLEHADAIFLTGTSPKIMPIASCGGVTFNVENIIVREVMKRYNVIIEEYIQSRKP